MDLGFSTSPDTILKLLTLLRSLLKVLMEIKRQALLMMAACESRHLQIIMPCCWEGVVLRDSNVGVYSVE